MALTQDEKAILKTLWGRMPHTMTSDELAQKGTLSRKASVDDLAELMGPQPETGKILGSLVKLPSGEICLHANSAHYADDEHYVEAKCEGSGHQDAYRLSSEQQRRAQTILEETSCVWAVVKNDKLGAPCGPILELIHEKKDTSHINPANEVARKAAEAAFDELRLHIVSKKNGRCPECQAGYEALGKPDRLLVGLCEAAKPLLDAYRQRWEAWTRGRTSCELCFDCCSVSSGHFAACDTCENRCSYHCKKPSENHGRRDDAPSKEECTCHWCNS